MSKWFIEDPKTDRIMAITPKALIELREHFGLSQWSMCRRLNVSPRQYQRYESGESPISHAVSCAIELHMREDFNPTFSTIKELLQETNFPLPIEKEEEKEENLEQAEG